MAATFEFFRADCLMTAPNLRQIFLSCVTAEFGEHRRLLKADLSLPDVKVQEQSDLVQGKGKLLQTLDEYLLGHCDAVIHLVGSESGQLIKPDEVRWLLATYSDFAGRFPFLADELQATSPTLSYTQMEAWLALYHEKRCHLYRSSSFRLDQQNTRPNEHSQLRHWQRLKDLGEHHGEFDNPQHLCRCVLRDLHDLLPPRPWLRGANARLSPVAVLTALLIIIVLLSGIWWTIVAGFRSRATQSSLDSRPSVLFSNAEVASDLRRLNGATEHDARSLALECENSHLRNLADILNQQPAEFFRFVQTYVETQKQADSDVLKLSSSDVDRLSATTEDTIIVAAEQCKSRLIQKLANVFKQQPSVFQTIAKELCK